MYRVIFLLFHKSYITFAANNVYVPCCSDNAAAFRANVFPRTLFRLVRRIAALCVVLCAVFRLSPVCFPVLAVNGSTGILGDSGGLCCSLVKIKAPCLPFSATNAFAPSFSVVMLHPIVEE